MERGPYKTFLEKEDCVVPESTQRRREAIFLLANRDLEQQAQQVNIENDPQQLEETNSIEDSNEHDSTDESVSRIMCHLEDETGMAGGARSDENIMSVDEEVHHPQQDSARQMPELVRNDRTMEDDGDIYDLLHAMDFENDQAHCFSNTDNRSSHFDSNSENENSAEYDTRSENLDDRNQDANDDSIEESDHEDGFLHNHQDQPAILQDDGNPPFQQPPVEVRIPIYDGCPLSKEESEVLILGLAVRHNLTDYALDDLIQVIDAHLPAPVHRSKYLIMKRCPISNINTYYYCPHCQELLPNDETNTKQCNVCKRNYDVTQLKSDNNFFLHFPLKDQIIDILDRYHQQLRKTSDTDSDIVNANVYKKLCQRRVIGYYDITIQWNTDGVNVFKSSKVSMWPIQVCINELPYRLRKDNILLCGLWYGTKKPIMDLFLKPFVDELKMLHDEGILYNRPGDDAEPVIVKVHTLLASVDAVARAPIQNITQFNGRYGCSYCLHEGERVPVKKGYARIYRGEEGLKRTDRQHDIDAEDAVSAKKAVRGVKGPSILMMLPIFSMVSSLPPDYMHNVLLGVTKMFATAWFDSTHYAKSWYLGRSTDEFDDRLTAIRPPCEITRTPRSITDRSSWKASEWKNFLLYYSMICLTGFMSTEYLQHWSLFVFSMHVFLNQNIADCDFIAAEQALRKFVLNVERLYGIEFMTYNVHVLLHVPYYVRKFGALWAWSTFPYEHYNGVLRDMFKNSQCVPQQICKSYLRLKSVNQAIFTVFERPDCSLRGREIITAILGKCRVKRCEDLGSYLRFFGVAKVQHVTVRQQVLIEQLLGEGIRNVVHSFERFIYKNILYHGSRYKRLTKRNNSTIQVTDGSLLEITEIIIVEASESNEKKPIIFGKVLEKVNDVLLCKFGSISSGTYSYIVMPTENIGCCLPEMIHKKCVNIAYIDQQRCIIPLVNVFERD